MGAHFSDVHASGSISADGLNANCPVLRGLSNPAVHAAPGIYPLTLDQGIDANECQIIVTPRTTADIVASVVHTSDTVKTVNMRSVAAAPAAADCAFDIIILRNSGGAGR